MTTITLHGVLRIRALPDPEWTPEEYAYWWLDSFEGGYRPARMSQREKERYTLYEARNLVVTAGITQVLTFIGSSSGTTPPFAQYLAIGNGNIFTTNANDSALSGEFFRKAVSGFTLSGNQVDISTSLAASDAVGSWTNMGIYGVNSTAIIGSGTMMTHLLVSFIKPNIARTADYLITAQ